MNMLADPSFILFVRTQHYYWRGAGLLSIKSFSGGPVLYDIGRGAFRVDEQCYLVLNHGQEYDITIEAEAPFTSFCVFFAAGLADDVRRGLTSQTETLLDDPAGAGAPPPAFFQRTYPHDLLLSPALNHLQEAYPLRGHDPGWLDEQFHTLMRQLLLVHQHASQVMAELPAFRPATREELYRRLHLARDYIRASYHRPLALDEIGGVACLSPNHLLRTFKQAFGQTPHQYLVDERLRQARHLLVSTKRTITEICLAVGFESLGSFSWLFRRRSGLSPQAFRALNQNQ